MEVNELKSRLSEALKELLPKFKSKSQLSKALSSNATSITQYIEGQNTFPQADFIFNLCNLGGYNPTWIILGIGDKKLQENVDIIKKDKIPYQKIGNNNSNITQVMHSNDILLNENEALKREISLLREMVELYKTHDKK